MVRGKLKPNAPLAPLVWFKSGGVAETLFEPADRDDLVDYVRSLEPDVPVPLIELCGSYGSATPHRSAM